jgi:ATP-dependent RNA helicase RhlE
LFFSATINPKIKKLAYSLVTNPIRIQISPKDPVSKNIDHTVAFIEMDDKRFFLEHLIKENEQRKLLIFVRTKVRAERVKKAMDRVNIDSDTIHSDKTDEERVKTIERFKEGTNKILIATDVSSRGIDIPNIEMVVNYDLPDVSENYVHRVGRTGRGRNKGKAITFCSTEEKEMLDEIQTFLDSEIQTVKLAKDAYSSVVTQSEEGLQDVDDLMKRIEDFDEASKQMKKKRKNRKK